MDHPAGSREIAGDRGAEDRLLVWAIVASQFGPPFMFSGVAVALPELGRDLAAGATSLGLVETLFLAGSMAFLLPIGRIADAADKATLFKASLGAFGLLSVAIGASSWMPLVLALRFVQGIASAVFAATGTALLADLVAPARRGKVFGASMGAVYVGLALGPLVAGQLVAWAGWRAVFWFGAAVILGGFAFVARRLPSKWRPPGRAVHVPSAVLMFLAVGTAVAGSALLRHGGVGPALLAGSLVLATVFVLLQLRLPRPLVDLRLLFSRAAFAIALLVQLLLYLNAFCAVFVLSLYLQVSLQVPPTRAGLLLATGPLLMAIVAPLAGALADRLRPQPVAAAGCAFVLLSSILGTQLGAASSPWSAALVVLAQGVGFGLFSSPNMAILMNCMPEATGMASALAAKARSIGMVTGMVVTASLISLHFGDAPVQAHPERFVGTLREVFTVLVGTSSLALLVSVLRRRPPRRISGSSDPACR